MSYALLIPDNVNMLHIDGKSYGWEFGGEIAGHIVGPYPHEQTPAGAWSLDIHPENQTDLLVESFRGIL